MVEVKNFTIADAADLKSSSWACWRPKSSIDLQKLTVKYETDLNAVVITHPEGKNIPLHDLQAVYFGGENSEVNLCNFFASNENKSVDT